MLGQTLLQEKLMNNATMHIDASSLQQGMYYVVIRTDKEVLVKKFVKE